MILIVSAYLCSLPIGLLSVLFVCLFVYVFYIFLLLFSNKMIKMKSSILSHGGTKNLISPTAKYRIVTSSMFDRIVKTYEEYIILI